MLQVTRDEMIAAENALVESGFSADQWMLIKRFVVAAIRNHLLGLTADGEKIQAGLEDTEID